MYLMYEQRKELYIDFQKQGAKRRDDERIQRVWI